MNNEINRPHERCLRIIYNDKTPFVDLLAKDGSITIHARNLRRKKIMLQTFGQLDFSNIIFCFFFFKKKEKKLINKNQEVLTVIIINNESQVFFLCLPRKIFFKKYRPEESNIFILLTDRPRFHCCLARRRKT